MVEARVCLLKRMMVESVLSRVEELSIEKWDGRNCRGTKTGSRRG